MKYSIYLASFLFFAQQAIAQYKNDNVLFKTVDPAELCEALGKNSNYLILDVRSKGEHYDTSAFASLNIGRLKGAKNISVQELGTRISEINQDKSRPVFVYCSHSQRSRRASKMLADSGFTNVYNINGGMTALYYTRATQQPCLDKMVETGNPYKIISATELCEMISKDKKPFILDVRTDSAWQHISRDAKENSYGHIKNAEHISLGSLPTRLADIPRNRELIITDLFGDQASKAALVLQKEGFNDISVLIEGVDRMLLTDKKEIPCKEKIYEPAVPFKLLNGSEFARFIEKEPSMLIIDLRSADEFANKHKDAFRNIGHIKNAINIPSSNIKDRLSELQDKKDQEILLYGFSGSPDVFAAAQHLQEQGFRKLTVLMGGIFNLRWIAANRKGMFHLMNLVTDVPESNF